MALLNARGGTMWSPCGSDRISRMLVEEPCGHPVGLTGLVEC